MAGRTNDQARAEDEGRTLELADLVKDYLDEQFDALAIGERAIDEGRLEFVHPTRVASRRYRTVLRDFADLFDPAAAIVLEESLRWYAQVLGEVRDVQVSRTAFAAALAEDPKQPSPGVDQRAIGATLEDYLAAREHQASVVLREAMSSRRYAAMIDQLRVWHDDLPAEEEESGAADDAVKPYVKRARRRVERRVAAAEEAGHPAELVHDARKAAKRARYVAELARPVLGRKAQRTVEQMTQLQDDLGARQDHEVALRLLADFAEAHDDAGFQVGVLYARLAPAS